MASIDLNQTFYHIPLALHQRQYFAFDYLNKRYCFAYLPFGLTASPRVFLKSIIKMARQRGIRVVAYLDNILIMASSKNQLLQHIDYLIECLQDHGFTINIKKSCLDPSQVVDYLGFQINSKTMTLKLPKRKIKDLIRECQRVKLIRSISVRKLASLIGKIIATTNAILPARLHSRALLRDKNYGLKKKSWNGTIQLSDESLIQLE